MLVLFLFFLIGCVLMIAPWLPSVMPGASVTAKAIPTAIGLFVVILSGVVTMIAKLYRKASANMAFVRTGMGGVRVIRDGGTIVLPVIHHVIPVSLETMRLNVDRRGPHAGRGAAAATAAHVGQLRVADHHRVLAAAIPR